MIPAEVRLGGSGETKWARLYREVQDDPSPWSVAGFRARLRHGYLSVAGRFAAVPESFVRCLYLHYVYDDQVDNFRLQLEELMRLGRFIDNAELAEYVAGTRPVRGRNFHLSFDDGFDNVHRNAMPVLRDLGLPWTLFVSTRLIGADRGYLAGREDVKSVPCPTLTMSWSEVEELTAAGCEIGAHTRHHSRLSDLSSDPARLEDEVAGAKADIEQALGRPCELMSWPYGTAADVDDVALRSIEAAGYRLCFSAIRGQVVAGATERLEVPRHHFEPEWPWSHVRYFALGGNEQGG